MQEEQKAKHIKASIDKSGNTEESKQNTNDSHEEQKSSFKKTNIYNNCESDEFPRNTWELLREENNISHANYVDYDEIDESNEDK